MKPASMAKVMTSYIVFDKIKDKSLKMSDTFLVSEKAWKMGGSRSFLELNSNVSISGTKYFCTKPWVNAA